MFSNSAPEIAFMWRSYIISWRSMLGNKLQADWNIYSEEVRTALSPVELPFFILLGYSIL